MDAMSDIETARELARTIIGEGAGIAIHSGIKLKDLRRTYILLGGLAKAEREFAELYPEAAGADGRWREARCEHGRLAIVREVQNRFWMDDWTNGTVGWSRTTWIRAVAHFLSPTIHMETHAIEDGEDGYIIKEARCFAHGNKGRLQDKEASQQALGLRTAEIEMTDRERPESRERDEYDLLGWTKYIPPAPSKSDTKKDG